MNLFELFLDKHAPKIQRYLNSNLPLSNSKEINLYLYDYLHDFISNAGKCHRPLITLLACHAVGGDYKKAISSACALEYFHSAALIHDDIADEGETRRGKPCMYVSQGTGLAINAGDLALSLVTNVILKDENLTSDEKVYVLNELVDMTSRTIEGQALDLGWARDVRYDITIDNYDLMAQHKTAFYSGGVPLALGAYLGGASPDVIQTLREFGMLVGFIFQIQDDLLNIIGDPQTVGKDFRTDITEGKRTLMVVHALNKSKRAQRLVEILELHTSVPELLQEAVDIMIEAGSIDFARTRAHDICEQSKNLLSSLNLNNEAQKLLISMADFFVDRLK